MKSPTEGEIVRYVMQLPGQVGVTEYIGLISRIIDRESGVVRLHIFTENTVIVRQDVPYNADKLPNTWYLVREAVS